MYKLKISDKVKDINIKNRIYKNSFSNILVDKTLYENISVDSISYKTGTGPKPLRIRFDKIDEFSIALLIVKLNI